MQLCNDTITLYNRRFDPEEDCDVYGRTVIRGVHWFNSDETTVDSTGLKAANKVTIRIPTDAEGLRPSTIHDVYFEAATILQVTDNRRAPQARHWKVVGA